jgi:hypothetical protein
MSDPESRIVIPPVSEWSAQNADLIAKVVLLILRAGQKDSLGWWDDESLTDAGRYAFDKLFPRNPRYLAVRLAFSAAKERHQGMLKAARIDTSVTIWDLAEPIMESFQGILPTSLHPIRTVEEFRQQLIHLLPSVRDVQIPAPDKTGLLDLSPRMNAKRQHRIDFIELLATGYLSGGVGNPVFPFLRPNSTVT